MPRSRSLLVLAMAMLATGCARSPQASGPTVRATAAEAPKTVRDLVTRMKGHYDGRWYNTLSFRQENVAYASGGENRSTWFERQHVPRRLRIDFLTPVADGSGILFRNDSAYSFQNGQLSQSAPQLHPLLLLSADLYALPVDTTVDALARLEIDTTQLRRDRWDDHPVWVVGAAAGDSTASQFWVDSDRWVLLRLLHSQRAGTRTVRTDYRFTYQTVDSLPVPQEIVFLRNGAPFWRETYTDVLVNPPVPDSIFLPTRWQEGVPKP
ncbi:MAG: LolA-like protein [Gemmatimonadaceae bacterium]